MEINKNSVSIYNNVEKSEAVYVESNLKPRAEMRFDYYPQINISGVDFNNQKSKFTTIIRDGEQILYSSEIETGMFSSSFKRGVFDCVMEAYDSSGILVSKFSLIEYIKTGNVCISVDSSSLGDTLAWIPYIEEFRKFYSVGNLTVTTFYNNLFSGMYPDIRFMHPGYREPDMLVVIGVGWYVENDINFHKNDPRTIPLQKVCSDILGIEYKGEIKPLLNKNIEDRPTDKKYVCIATESTAGAKYWHNPGGWQRLVNLLKSVGYDVVIIQKEQNTLSGVIDKTGNYPLENRISDLSQCEFFVGLGSGLSWLSWSLDKPTVMISGFSDPFFEFSDKCLRIINKNVCHGCFTNPNYKFDRGDWWWCPVHKGTERAFECTKHIKPEDVLISILDWKESEYKSNLN